MGIPARLFSRSCSPPRLTATQFERACRWKQPSQRPGLPPGCHRPRRRTIDPFSFSANQRFNEKIAQLYSKAWSAEFLRNIVSRWKDELWLCAGHEAGVAVDTLEDATVPKIREGALCLNDPAKTQVCLAVFRVSRT